MVAVRNGRSASREGFTLIELMVVVTILSILAAVAIPQLQIYIRRSKAAEVSIRFGAMYKKSSTIWGVGAGGDTERGIFGEETQYCTPNPSPFTPDSDPGPEKQEMTFDTLLHTLGMPAGEFVYYSYAIDSEPACDRQANDPDIMTFRAMGDLDGDDDNSLFELALGTDGQNQLYHAAGIYIVDETE